MPTGRKHAPSPATGGRSDRCSCMSGERSPFRPLLPAGFAGSRGLSGPKREKPRRRSERRGLPYMTAAFLSACRRIAKRTPPGPSADVFPDPPALRASREGIARPRRSSPAVRRIDVVAVSAERVVTPRRSSPSKRTATPRKRSRTCRLRRSTPPEDGPRPRATAKT